MRQISAHSKSLTMPNQHGQRLLSMRHALGEHPAGCCLTYKTDPALTRVSQHGGDSCRQVVRRHVVPGEVPEARVVGCQGVMCAAPSVAPRVALHIGTGIGTCSQSPRCDFSAASGFNAGEGHALLIN